MSNKKWPTFALCTVGRSLLKDLEEGSFNGTNVLHGSVILTVYDLGSEVQIEFEYDQLDLPEASSPSGVI